MVPPPHADMPSPRANDANRARASRPNQLNFMCFLHLRPARHTKSGRRRNLSWREYKPSSDCSGGRGFLPMSGVPGERSLLAGVAILIDGFRDGVGDRMEGSGEGIENRE